MIFVDYIKFCKDEKNLPNSNLKFRLKVKSIIDVHKTSQTNKTVRYYQNKDDVKAKCNIEDKKLDDVEYILGIRLKILTLEL
jgi:hypothetical protein